jgi:hypothetical protein
MVTTRIAGEWVDMDPREWRNQFDVTINVGIGMGNKDQKVQHTMMLLAQQEKVFALGVANPQNVYEASTELAKLLGHKNADKFFNDPTKHPAPPKPDPEQMKMQGLMQIEQMKQQGTAQGVQFKAQADGQIEQMKIQMQAQAAEADRAHEAALEQMRAQMQAQVDNNAQAAQERQRTVEQQNEAQLNQMKFQSELEHKVRDLDFQRWKVQLEAETRVLVAQIAANTTLTTAQIASAESAEKDEAGE